MIKYKIDSVAKENKNTEDHVVYVKLYDDKSPEVMLSNICVAYRNKEQFEAELESKTNKYLSSVSQQKNIKILVEQSILVVENKVGGII